MLWLLCVPHGQKDVEFFAFSKNIKNIQKYAQNARETEWTILIGCTRTRNTRAYAYAVITLAHANV